MKKFKCSLVLLLTISLLILSISSIAIAGDDDQLVFAMVARDISDPFHAIVADGAQSECDKLGVKFVLKDSGNDLMTQLNIVDTLISMGVDGVAINAVDGAGVIPAINALDKAGIPVVGFDTLPDGGKFVACVGVDNVDISHSAGKALIRGLKEKYGEVPEGVVLDIMGSVAMQIGRERRDGFNNALAEYPQLEIAEAQGMWNPDDAYKVTSDLMTKYGKQVVGMYTAAGCMAPGIASAIKSAGYDMKDIVFTSIGPFAIDLQLIEEGKEYSSVVVPSLAQGELSMKLLYYAVNNMMDKMPKIGELMVEEGEFWSPAKVVEFLGAPRVNVNIESLCPQDVPTDAPRLLGTLINKKQEEMKK